MEENKFSDSVRVHNKIVSGRDEWTACQMDLFFMSLALLGRDDPPYKVYRIHRDDIELLTGREWHLTQLRESSKGLMGNVIEYKETRGDSLLLHQVTLFSRFTYVLGEQSIEFKINEDAKHLFFELKENYTPMQLKSIISCSSKYAKRLYGMALQWRNTEDGSRSQPYEISELKELLGLIDPKGKKTEQYTKIAGFKSKVLEIAKKQINENTDVNFDYKLIKKGRSFKYIKLYFKGYKPVVQLQLPLDFNQDVEYQRKIKSILAVGISENLAEKWAEKKESWLAFVDAKELVKLQIQKGDVINDFPAYIVGIMKKKGF